MGSKRDRFKKLNQDRFEDAITQEKEIKPVTIVDELADNYDRLESSKEPEKDDSEASSDDSQGSLKIDKEENPSLPVLDKKNHDESIIINVIDKSNVGRPKILQGVYKPISARLKMENYEHAKLVGGRYGGMNGYINYLIEQDIKKSK